MTTLLIGHRGTGKTAFLKSLQEYAAARGLVKASFFDLDQEIESHSGKKIVELFAEGEAAFRLAEKKTFAALMDRDCVDRYVALGAGFEGPLPQDAHVIWLRRETDGGGRVFLHRPRLNPQLSAIDEYRRRFDVREHRFRAWAHEQLFLPEGYAGGLEQFVLEPHAIHLPYDFTLLPGHFRDWEAFWEKRSTWGLRRWELRDDLLSPLQISRARESIPQNMILHSVRREPKIPSLGRIDWDVSHGPAPQAVEILSRHEREGSLAATLRNFESDSAEVLKLAIEVADFGELEMGHDWWLKAPRKRAFLPRSKDGRWRWYRQLFGPRMPVHFYREDEGSSADQPFYWQMLSPIGGPLFEDRFAAVLGSPIRHSLSPLEHVDFFKRRKMPFVAVDVREEEFTEALGFLTRLGLSHAAVTSPLKRVAFTACNKLSSEAEGLKAVNSLRIEGSVIEGHNTDVLALKELAKELDPVNKPGAEVWLWGGGGVRSSVRAAFPGVKEFSARTGLPHASARDFTEPAVLIWAAGRTQGFRYPPESMKNTFVLDLNYGDDSPGLEWAAARNLAYQSGLKMFKLQAEFQRHFWQGSKGSQ